MIKNSAYAGLLVVLVFATVSGCDAHASAPPELQGILEYDERVLAFDVGGRLRRVTVERGDRIDVPRVIAELDDSLERPLRAARAADVDAARAQLALLRAGARREDVRAAASQLRAARESEALLERTLARQTNLATLGAAAPAHLDELRNQLVQIRGQRETLTQRLTQLRHGARPEEIATAESRLAAASAALESVETRLAHYVLHSAGSGVVLDVHSEPGEVVSPGAPVVTVGNLDHPFVNVYVPQNRMATVRLGGTGTLRVDGSTRRFSATVEYISPRTEFTPRFLFSERERPNLVVRVRVRVSDPEHRLHAGVPAFVALEGAAP